MSAKITHTRGDPKETRLVSMPQNAEEWEKDNVSACSLDPQLSVVRRTSSCNNSIGRTVSFCEGSFCDPVEIVMSDLKVQRTCLKFCFLLGKTPTESLEMLQEAFKEQALSRARVFEWFSRFKRGFEHRGSTPFWTPFKQPERRKHRKNLRKTQRRPSLHH